MVIFSILQADDGYAIPTAPCKLLRAPLLQNAGCCVFPTERVEGMREYLREGLLSEKKRNMRENEKHCERMYDVVVRKVGAAGFWGESVAQAKREGSSVVEREMVKSGGESLLVYVEDWFYNGIY